MENWRAAGELTECPILSLNANTVTLHFTGLRVHPEDGRTGGIKYAKNDSKNENIPRGYNGLARSLSEQGGSGALVLVENFHFISHKPRAEKDYLK